MAKFAPNYMSCYDGPEYTFGTLLLSADEITEDSAQGTDIGTISGKANATDSSLSIVDANGLAATDGYFQLNGAVLEAGANFGDLTPDDYDVIIRETNPWAPGQYQDETFTITVNAP